MTQKEFLVSLGITRLELECYYIEHILAERVGDWSDYWGGYTYQTLMSAVNRYKLPFGCGPMTIQKARVLIDLAEALASEEVEE